MIINGTNSFKKFIISKIRIIKIKSSITKQKIIKIIKTKTILMAISKINFRKSTYKFSKTTLRYEKMLLTITLSY